MWLLMRILLFFISSFLSILNYILNYWEWRVREKRVIVLLRSCLTLMFSEALEKGFISNWTKDFVPVNATKTWGESSYRSFLNHKSNVFSKVVLHIITYFLLFLLLLILFSRHLFLVIHTIFFLNNRRFFFFYRISWILVFLLFLHFACLIIILMIYLSGFRLIYFITSRNWSLSRFIIFWLGRLFIYLALLDFVIFGWFFFLFRYFGRFFLGCWLLSFGHWFNFLGFIQSFGNVDSFFLNDFVRYKLCLFL